MHATEISPYSWRITHIQHLRVFLLNFWDFEKRNDDTIDERIFIDNEFNIVLD
jgi:hypothetical protein